MFTFVEIIQANAFAVRMKINANYFMVCKQNLILVDMKCLES